MTRYCRYWLFTPADRWLLKRRKPEIKIDSRTEVAVVSNLTWKMTMDEAVKQ